MMFDVTFKFDVGEATTTVRAETFDDAIYKARNRYHPPVPDDVLAMAVNAGPGGKRNGSGVKAGSKRTANPRTIQKQIKWTEKEWAQIESDAAATGQSVAEYQRDKLLNG